MSTSLLSFLIGPRVLGFHLAKVFFGQDAANVFPLETLEGPVLYRLVHISLSPQRHAKQGLDDPGSRVRIDSWCSVLPQNALHIRNKLLAIILIAAACLVASA